MERVLQVLAIDDHGVVLEGYNAIFKSIYTQKTIKFLKASDCKTGYEVVKKNEKKPFDIAVVDYSIPSYEEENLFSGEDMALFIRQAMPACKIVMMTMHKEVDIMARILQKIEPEGFINKSDCTTDELIAGFKYVIEGGVYYSKTVSNYIKRTEKGVVLDDVDIRIIQLLAKGIKNKNLDKYILLSSSGIEKRKYRIKRLLEVEGDDEALINEARSRGYI